ncbi:hypothetical protein HY522_10305 [bacterium]|nr:hypothetical protein [bacterium]
MNRSALLTILAVALFAAWCDPAAARMRTRKIESRQMDVSLDSLSAVSQGVYLQIHTLTSNVSFVNLSRPPSLTISVQCRTDPDHTPYEYVRHAKVQSVRYDRGWQPSPEDFLPLHESRRHSKLGRNNNSFTVQIVLPLPDRKATEIERLEGSITALFREPPRDTAFLALTDPEDPKRAAAAGMVRLTLQEVVQESRGRTIARIDGRSLESFDESLQDLYEWELVLRTGKSIPSRSLSTGYSGDVLKFNPEFDYDGKPGHILGIAVSWVAGRAETEIPFVFENIPLP